MAGVLWLVVCGGLIFYRFGYFLSFNPRTNNLSHKDRKHNSTTLIRGNHLVLQSRRICRKPHATNPK